MILAGLFKPTKLEVIDSQLLAEVAHAQSHSRIRGLSALCRKCRVWWGLPKQPCRICSAHDTNSQVRQQSSLCIKQNTLKPACVGNALPTNIPHQLILQPTLFALTCVLTINPDCAYVCLAETLRTDTYMPDSVTIALPVNAVRSNLSALSSSSVIPVEDMLQ